MESKLRKKFKSKCPGSLMIVGEHAVLHGEPCIVAAINKYLEVELDIISNNNKESEIVIETSLGTIDNPVSIPTHRALCAVSREFNSVDGFRGQAAESREEELKHQQSLEAQCSNSLEYKSLVKNLEISKPLDYVLTAINFYKQDLVKNKYIYRFKIKSNINPTMGLGSSAAVTIAMVQVLENCRRWLNNQECFDFQKIINNISEQKKILNIAKEIIIEIQGKGSGADLAASLLGGVIYYKSDLSVIEKITDSLPIIAVYSGYKLSTSDVIAKVDKAFASMTINKKTKQADLYQSLFSLIGEISESAKYCILDKNWKKLGELFNTHYGLQQVLNLSDNNIDNIVNNLKANKNIYGAKISGSGLGDCVIAVGEDLKTSQLGNNLKSIQNTGIDSRAVFLKDIKI